MAGPVSLLTDLHSHILPGIDDGAAGIDEALAIARARQTVKRDWAVARLFLQREIASSRDE